MKQKFSLKTIVMAFVAVGLMLTTVTSCKDYGDDIASIKNDVAANKTAIEAVVSDLAGFKASGMLVKSVAPISNGIKITFSDGTSYDVVNGADGAPGANGTNGTNGSVVEVKDGELYIDGVKKDLKNDVNPTKVEVKNGELYVNDAATGIKVGGVTAVSDDKSITFTLADGKTVTLPFATSKLNSIVFVPTYNHAGHEPVIIVDQYKFKYLKTDGTKPSKKDVGLNPYAQSKGHYYGSTGGLSTQTINHSLPVFRTLEEGSPTKHLSFTKGYSVLVDVNPTNFDINGVNSFDFESMISKIARRGNDQGVMEVVKEGGNYMVKPVAGIPGRYEIKVSGATRNRIGSRRNFSNYVHPLISVDGRREKVEKLQLSVKLKGDDEAEILSDWITPLAHQYCVLPAIARDYSFESQRGNLDTAPNTNYSNSPLQSNDCYIYQGDYDMVSGPDTYDDMLQVSVPVLNKNGTVHVFDLNDVVKLVNRTGRRIADGNGGFTEVAGLVRRGALKGSVYAGCCNNPGGGGNGGGGGTPLTEESCVAELDACENLETFKEGFGLHYEFYPVEHKVYGGTSATDQQIYVTLEEPVSGAGGVLYTKGKIKANSGNPNRPNSVKSAVGRSPLFQVRLVDAAGNVYALHYIRLKFVDTIGDPQAEPFTATYEQLVFTECKPSDLGNPRETITLRDGTQTEVFAATYGKNPKIDGRFISTFKWTNDHIYTQPEFGDNGISAKKFAENYTFDRAATDAMNADNAVAPSPCNGSGKFFYVDGLIQGGIDENNTGTSLFSIYKRSNCVEEGTYYVGVVFTRKPDSSRPDLPTKVVVKVKVKINGPEEVGGDFWNFYTGPKSGARLSGQWATTTQESEYQTRDNVQFGADNKGLVFAKGAIDFDFDDSDNRGILPRVDLLNAFYTDSSLNLKEDEEFTKNLIEYFNGADGFKFELDTEHPLYNTMYTPTIVAAPVNVNTTTTGVADPRNKSVLALDEWPSKAKYVPVKLTVYMHDFVNDPRYVTNLGPNADGYDVLEITEGNGEVITRTKSPNCYCHVKTYNFLVRFENPAKVIGTIEITDTDAERVQFIDLVDMAKVYSQTNALGNAVTKESFWAVEGRHGKYASSTKSTTFSFDTQLAYNSTKYFEKAIVDLANGTQPLPEDAVNVTTPTSSTDYKDIVKVTWLNYGGTPVFDFWLDKERSSKGYQINLKAMNLNNSTVNLYNELETSGTLRPTFIYYGYPGTANLTKDLTYYINVRGKYGSGDETTAGGASNRETTATASYYYGVIKVVIKKSI